MRKKRQYKRDYRPDADYGSIALARFTNRLMVDGKKSVAEKVVQNALAKIKKEMNNFFIIQSSISLSCLV